MPEQEYDKPTRQKLEEDGIDVAEPEDDDYVGVNAGGCWICNRGCGGSDNCMEFDPQMDGFYHPVCLKKTGCGSLYEFEERY